MRANDIYITQMRANDISIIQMRANDIYITQMRANNIAICTFSRFIEKWPRNDWEMTKNGWEVSFLAVNDR